MSEKSNLENIELKNRVDTLTLKEFETFLKIFETQLFNKKVSNINSYADVKSDTLEKFLNKYKEIFNKKYGEKHKVYTNFKTIFEIISNNFKLEKIIPSPENLNIQISKIMEKTFDENKLINDVDNNNLYIINDVNNKINKFIDNDIDFQTISDFLNKTSISREFLISKQENVRKQIKNIMINKNLEIQKILDKSTIQYLKSVDLNKKLNGYNNLSDIEQNLEFN